MGIKNKFKIGAASFYVVAFSTLILVIIASSFASAIIMEIARSSNEDLSQSAYDAAMAGVEDAKVAFANYRNCVKSGVKNVTELSTSPNVTCQDIVYWMEHADKDSCDVVARILGRIGKNAVFNGVPIEETGSSTSGGENNMNQAYTCTTIQMHLDDYRADLSPTTPYKVVKVDLKNVDANDIKAVRVSWFSNNSERTFDYTNMVSDGEKDRVAFQSLNLENAPTPPTLGFQLIQTASGSFSLTQLNGKTTASGETDRAMLYLVPTNNATLAANTHTGTDDKSTYIGAYDSTQHKNILTGAQFANTNNHSKNYPYAVYCPTGSSDEYACSAVIGLPSPIGGTRNNDTFMFVISIPYGQPSTDFSLEFLCGVNGEECSTIAGSTTDDDEPSNIARLENMQLLIDSTGRANDLYRRVEIRLESSNDVANYPLYAIQIDGKPGDKFEKDMQVTTEWSEDAYASYTNW